MNFLSGLAPLYPSPSQGLLLLTDWQMDGQTYEQTDRQMDGQTYEQTDRHIDKQIA